MTSMGHGGLIKAARGDLSASNSARRKGQRLVAIDGLRGIAALLVLVLHYELIFFGGQRWTYFGLLGVELFFVISGFVILMSLERYRNLKAFAVARCARLYPAYTISVGFAGLYALWVGSATFPAVAVNLTMLQGFLDTPDVVTSYWSLKYELWFYFVLAMAYRLRLASCLDPLAFLWLAAMSATRLYEVLVLGGPIDKLENGRLYLLLMPQFGHFFIIGMMIYKITVQQQSWWTKPVLVWAVVYSIFGRGSWAPVSPAVYLPVTIALAITVWGAATSRFPVLASKPLCFLGGCSYPLYLFHQPIGEVLRDTGDLLQLPIWSVAIAAVPVSIAVAEIIYRTVEQPSQRWAKAMIRSWRIPPLLAAGHSP
jgi:peptidoglycan/LPS O-acetylase OafA/YrhL